MNLKNKDNVANNDSKLNVDNHLNMENFEIFNENSLDNTKDDIFMQLQTEFFDLLLEINHILPYWSSYFGNFYFHWKKIIGASNIKDIHPYRLIFRCLGSNRPSSTSQCTIKSLLRQLDEFRKISENNYIIPNLEEITRSYNQNSIIDTTKLIYQAFLNENNNLNYSKISSDEKHKLIKKNNSGKPTDDILLYVSKEQDNTNNRNEKDNSTNSELLEIPNNFLNQIYELPEKKTLPYSPNMKKNKMESIYNSDCLFNQSNFNSVSSLSSSNYTMTVPIIAAFQHIHAVAVAATAVSQSKNFNVNTIKLPLDINPPKKRPRRNGEIQGVYFDKIRKLWRANWKENGRVKTKGFSVFQFGEGAKIKAIEYRKKMEKEFYIVPTNSRNINFNDNNNFQSSNIT